ncbi:hypothetical protein [Daejeonella sp.]|uniref:hypothetical protein n=1 Tax=Daejeonella sp. TaxID=2805397 RepID=UPI0030C320EC
MKRIAFVFLLLFTGQFSQGQELPAKDFYLHLEKVIPTIKSHSIALTVINYGCLGSQTKWSAKFTNIGNLIRVDFFSQTPKDRMNPSSELKTLLDTTFTVERRILQQDLESEITKIKTRPVFIEANFKISLDQGTSNKEFTFRRGEGLYYLLRYNKTLESYFASR